MPQWTLFENDFQAIDRVLERLLEKTNALSVHLIDRSGQLITTSGRSADFDATAFASLVAADFTANAEVSQLLGEASVEAVVQAPEVGGLPAQPRAVVDDLEMNLARPVIDERHAVPRL